MAKPIKDSELLRKLRVKQQKRIDIDPTLLRRLYLDRKLGLKAIAELFDVNTSTIRRRLHGLHIPIRNYIVEHDQLLTNELIKLKKRGFRVIPLKKPLPDGIAIDFDNKKVYAVELERNPTKKKLNKYANTNWFDDIFWIIR